MGPSPMSLRPRVRGLVGGLMVLAALVLSANIFGATGALAPNGGIGSWVVEGVRTLAAQEVLSPRGSGTEGETANADLVRTVAAMINPAVVTVSNLQETSSPFGGTPEPEAVGIGSGFIVDTEGHVVTNNHVVEGADVLSVLFSDGTTADATLLGRDAFQDVAVLQLDLSGSTAVPGTVTLGTSGSGEFGDTVFAIGTALGEYPNTVTTGSIEGVDRELDTGYEYELAHLIQHDAELWPGNSGGPLLNMDGDVIGMNVAGSNRFGLTTSGSEIGFAIDINAVMDIAQQLITNGTVARPYLGIESAPAVSGQQVAAVVSSGPAEKAGIEVTDVITAVDNQEVDSTNPLLNLLFEHDPGETVTLTVERDGEQQTLDVVLGERPAETS